MGLPGRCLRLLPSPPGTSAASATSAATAPLFDPHQRRHIERLQRGVNYQEFCDMLAEVDRLLRALPATAQVGRGRGAQHSRSGVGWWCRGQPWVRHGTY